MSPSEIERLKDYNGTLLDMLNEEKQFVRDRYLNSYLTISAIDGTVINNILGY